MEPTADLVPRWAERDRLVRDHLNLVRSIASRLLLALPPCYDIDDLIGVGNLALLAAAESFRPNDFLGVPFGAYARHRVRGAMLDIARRSQLRERTMPPLEGVPEGSYLPVPEELVDQAREIARVRVAIGRLPAREQRIINLHYAGEAFKQIARVLGLSESRISQLHKEALEALRSDLGGESRDNVAVMEKAAFELLDALDLDIAA